MSIQIHLISSLGKTTAWRVLLTVLNRLENSDGQAHVIDPKAISKDDLYGFLDQNTRKFLFLFNLCTIRVKRKELNDHDPLVV